MWYLAYFLLHLMVYTLIRIEFLVWNLTSLEQLSFLDLLKAFFWGGRFDFSAISPLVGLCFLGLIWGGYSKWFKTFWIWFFTALHSVFLIINFIDVELYNFTARRFASSSFFLVQDAQVSNLITPYIPLATASLFIFLIYLFLVYKLSLKKIVLYSTSRKVLSSFGVLLLAILFSRGGFQHKPISFVDAKLFDNSYANNLVLNSTFTLLKSASRKSLNRVSYFTQSEMLSYLNEPTPVTVEVNTTDHLNVIVLVLESFSKEYLELNNPEVTPYLNQLAREGVSFENSYANGRRSIEGIAAILSGIPALMEDPFINSEFSANQIIGLGEILEKHQYQTSFYHAANKGSMHFDSFSKSVGIKDYYSKTDYPFVGDDDGTWGIFDEPFLKWTCGKLTEEKTPFFSLVFTLSSHQPYAIPEKYSEVFTDSRLPILKSIQYTDFALKEFMSCAQQKNWFKNTLFIITADHTGPELNPNSTFESRYRVPLILWAPQMEWIKKINSKQWVQHIDILPSLLDILKIEHKNINYLSRSFLRSGDKLVALYSDGQYSLLGQVKDNEMQLKAVQQYFSQGLYDNRLYYPLK